MDSLRMREGFGAKPAGEEVRSDLAVRMARGVCRRLLDLGYRPLTEFTLTGGRRVDVIGLNDAGRFLVVEIKTSVADFRGDAKWPDYLAYCDEYYFAVPPDFPADLLPDEHGLIVADAFDAAVRRPAPVLPMNATRRRHQILKFGLAASERLFRGADSWPPAGGPATGTLDAWRARRGR